MVNFPDPGFEKKEMNIPDDPLERKKWMMDLLKVYGQQFLIFEPEDQPNVFASPEPEYREEDLPGPIDVVGGSHCCQDRETVLLRL